MHVTNIQNIKIEKLANDLINFKFDSNFSESQLSDFRVVT